MSNHRRPVDDTDDGTFLEELPDGSGCFEIWEHLSDIRERSAGD